MRHGLNITMVCGMMVCVGCKSDASRATRASQSAEEELPKAAGEAPVGSSAVVEENGAPDGEYAASVTRWKDRVKAAIAREQLDAIVALMKDGDSLAARGFMGAASETELVKQRAWKRTTAEIAAKTLQLFERRWVLDCIARPDAIMVDECAGYYKQWLENRWSASVSACKSMASLIAEASKAGVPLDPDPQCLPDGSARLEPDDATVARLAQEIVDRAPAFKDKSQAARNEWVDKRKTELAALRRVAQ